MNKGLTIRARLWLLAAAMVLPYVLFAAFSFQDAYRQAVQHALDERETDAQRVAMRLAEHVDRLKAMLAAVDSAVYAHLDDASQVDARLRRMLPEISAWATTLGAFGPDGRMIALTDSRGSAQAAISIADRKHFRDAVRTRAFAVGDPIVARFTGRNSIVVARPLLGPDGEVRAVLTITVDAATMDRILEVARPHADSVAVLAAENGAVIATAPSEPARWGSDQSDAPYFRVARGGGVFKGEVASDDGVRRLGASVPVANAPWQVFVGTPVEKALAPARTRFREQITLALLMLAVAAGVAWAIARGLALPILRLRRGVNALAVSGLATRVSVNGGGELGELAADINRMAARLEDADARLRSRSALSSDWYWEADADSVITAIEGERRAPLGLDPQALVGKPLWRSGYRITGGRRATSRIAENRAPFRDLELVRTDAGGEIAEVILVSGEPRFAPDGTYLGYRGVAHDVSEHNRLEAAVRRAQAQLRLVVNAVPAMIAYVDRAKRFVFVNTTYEQITNRAPAETVGLEVRAVLGAEIFAIIEPYMDRALAGETVEFTRQHRRPDGTTRDLRIQYAPDRGAEGEVQGIIGMVSDVTELKQTQRTLAESEARYRELAELSSDWYWETDQAHRFSYLSPGIERNLDVSTDGLIGKARWEVDYLDTSEADWAAHRAVLDARQPFRDLRLKRRNRAGRVTYQSITGRPRFDAEGRFLGYRGVGHDITAKTEAEIALRAGRDRLQLIIETMAEGLAILDAQGRYVLVNASAERILGARRETIVGRHYLDVPWIRRPLAGSEKSLPQDAFERLRVGRDTVVGPALYALERADGLQLVLSHHSARIDDARGGFAGVVATFEDITERMRAEGRLQLYLASALDGYWMTDMEGHILEVNRAMCELLGFSEEEMLQRSAFDFVVGEPAAALKERMARIRDAGHLRAEVQRRRKDGTIVHLEGAATYLPIEGGRVFAFFKDITERKRAERELAAREREITKLNADLERRVEERTAELTAAYREMESFSYSVSHDLRAPLRAISGFSHILMEDFRGEVPAEANRLLARVAQNAERMGALIDGLLEFGRLSRQPLRKQRIDPAELVREVIEELAPARQEREVDVQIGKMPPCWADRVLLKQVFANLVGNAFKYSGQRKQAKVEIGSIAMGLGPVYYVRDNGAGFDMAHAGKLFGMFQRLHSPAEFEGNGVGLALVRRIVERHDGKVWADAAAGKGATFFFRLGAEPAAGEAGAKQAA